MGGIAERSAPWYSYLAWLWREEKPLLLLGIVGMVAALVTRTRFPVFASAWSVSLLVAYSILPYKTPWILLNVLLPMCIVSGYLAQTLWERTGQPGSSWGRRLPAVALITAALAASIYRSVWLNFYHYDDQRSAFPYVQTDRRFLDLVARVEQIGNHAGTGVATPIMVESAEYWPLPWYLRDYTNVGYFGRVIAANAPVVIGSKKQETELRALLPSNYEVAGTYPLRPGVDLVLFFSGDQKH